MVLIYDARVYASECTYIASAMDEAKGKWIPPEEHSGDARRERNTAFID